MDFTEQKFTLWFVRGQIWISIFLDDIGYKNFDCLRICIHFSEDSSRLNFWNIGQICEQKGEFSLQIQIDPIFEESNIKTIVWKSQRSKLLWVHFTLYKGRSQKSGW